MTNLTASDDLSLAQDDIDALWRNINKAPSDPVGHWIAVASFIFAILGSLSNLMSVIVLSRLSAQLSTFVYLTGLSLSDMITCISIVMTYIIDNLVQTRRSSSIVIFLRYVDIVFGALATGSRVLSLWISTAVTMDRWVLICYPIYAKTFCTLNRAKILSGTLFLIAFLYSVPLFFEYEIVRMPMGSQNIELSNESSSLIDELVGENSMLITKGYSHLARLRLYRWAYMFFNGIFVYTVPTVTIVYFNIQLIRALRRVKSRAKRLGIKSTTNETNQRTQNRSSQSKYSVTTMVITMVLTLLICRSPTIVLWVLWSFELTIKIFVEATSSAPIRRFHSIANLIAIINAATNFLPFCVFGQLFRAECSNIYCCRKPTNNSVSKSPNRKLHENNQRTNTEVITQQPTTILSELPPNALLLTSDTTESTFRSSKNLIKSYNLPSHSILLEQQQHLKTSTVTTSLLDETNNL